MRGILISTARGRRRPAGPGWVGQVSVPRGPTVTGDDVAGRDRPLLGWAAPDDDPTERIAAHGRRDGRTPVVIDHVPARRSPEGGLTSALRAAAPQVGGDLAALGLALVFCGDHASFRIDALDRALDGSGKRFTARDSTDMEPSESFRAALAEAGAGTPGTVLVLDGPRDDTLVDHLAGRDEVLVVEYLQAPGARHPGPTDVVIELREPR